MANIVFSTVGASFSYCVEATKGTRPTSGYTAIPDVSAVPGIDLTPETLDASSLADYITRYIMGRQDTGGALSVTLNHTDEAITAWKTMKTASDTARASGLATWFELKMAGAADSFYFSAQVGDLGTNGAEQNSVDTIPAALVVTGLPTGGGWQTTSTDPVVPA